MRVIDIHTHYFPDAIASRAIHSLVENSGVGGNKPLQPCHNGTYQGLKELLEHSGIELALNLPVATKAQQVDSINARAIAQNSSPIYSFGSIHPDSTNKREILTHLKQSGIKGIKLHPQYQDFELEDSRMSEVYALCQELGLIILLHCGKDGSYSPPFKSSPKRLLEIHKTWPLLKLIGGHFGGLGMWDQVEEFLIGEKIYIDTSIIFHTHPKEKIIKMLLAHPSEYLLFGSDAPWGNPKDDLNFLLNLPIPQDLKNKICWQNSATLLGLS